MEYSTAPFDQPVGLQRLGALDCIEVHSTKTWTGCKYEVREGSGEHLFDVKEEPKSIFNLSCAFTMALSDVNGVEAISIHRKNLMIGCRLQISIQGALVSLVHQKLSGLTPLFELLDTNETPAYRLKGPWDQSGSYQFELTTMDKTPSPVGAFSREWGGWRKELTSYQDYLNITFPQHLPLQYKAACVAAAVHIIDVRRRRR